MKKLTTCVVAVTGFIGTSAFAADMGVPPAPSPAPVWNWTGWYAGVNVGASFGNAKTDFNVAPVTATLLFGTELGKNVTGPGVPFSDREYPDGFMGGGQIGYNWQFSPIWVVGLEADFQGALERDSANLNNPFSATTTFFSAGGVPISPATVTGTAVTDYTTKIEWFGTARVRIGYVWGNGDVMSYLTGGLAYGKVDLEGTNTVNGAFLVPIFIPFTVSSNFSHSAINAGWVVGYGTEGRLGNSNWTWKVEGLYMDLGTLDTSVSTAASTGSSALGPGTATGGLTTHTHFTDSILRGGLNYQFH